MGRTGAKMPIFCLNKIRPLVRIRSSPSENSTSNYEANGNEDVAKEIELEKEKEKEKSFEVVKPANVVGRRIMIVIDSSVESKSALQWALTHTVQIHDEVLLLYVKKNCTNKGDEENNKEMSRRVSVFLSSMKSLCNQKRPEVKVEVIIAEGKEKGAVIVEEAQKAGVSMLILGQKKKRSLTAWRLVMIWAGNKATRGGMVEYCIQNAACMAIAVRRKSKKLGGYLITTKRHKDFWLLA